MSRKQSTMKPNDSSLANEDPVEKIVQNIKLKGIFDEFRKECLEDVDTKPAFMNLRQRLDGYVNRYLAQQKWEPTLNKNQLRERLRQEIYKSDMFKFNTDHLVEQVLSQKAKNYMYPRIEPLVKEYLGITDDDSKDEKLEEEKTKEEEKDENEEAKEDKKEEQEEKESKDTQLIEKVKQESDSESNEAVVKKEDKVDEKIVKIEKKDDDDDMMDEDSNSSNISWV